MQLVERKDLNEAEVPVAIKSGMMVLAHLQKYQEVRVRGELDLEYEMFDQVHMTCSVFCSFAECHLARLGESYSSTNQRDILLEVGSSFQHISNIPPNDFFFLPIVDFLCSSFIC